MPGSLVLCQFSVPCRVFTATWLPLFSLDYQRFLFAKTVEVFHRQSILQLLSDENGQVFSSSTGIRYAFSELIDTNFRIDLAYESDPPPGNEKTDTTYSLGVGLKF